MTRRTSIPQHAAGGLTVTGPLSISGVLDVTSLLVVKNLQANSAFAGVTTILSGTASIVVSASSVKSDSLLYITAITANASNLAQNYSINPASTVDGKSFMVIAEGNTVANVPVNYQIIDVI